MPKLLQHKGEITFQLPDGWNLDQTLFKAPSPIEQSTQEMLVAALKKPMGTPPLEQILKPGISVAVVIDDLTRATPVYELLPLILDIIERRGIACEQVDIVVGTGTHVAMSDRQIESRVGRDTARRYRIHNHDSRSPDLVVAGTLEGYGPIAFNAVVAEADIRITLGSISPHIHNGFGGGPKNIMPGICDFDTIRRHHLKNYLDPGSRIGITDGNRFLQDTIRIAGLLRVDFTIQCLYDSCGRICKLLTGEMATVFKAAIAEETARLGVPVGTKSDITIVSSYPYDEGFQFTKAFLPAAMVTKPGGTILAVTEVTEPLPDLFLQQLSHIRGRDATSAGRHIIQKLHRREPLVTGAGIDFTGALVLIFCVAQQFALTIVGSDVLKPAAAAMGCGYAPDVATALAETDPGHPRATVNVIPAGGFIFPIINEPFYLFGDREAETLRA